MSMFTLFAAVNQFLRLISLAIFVYVVLSWLKPNNKFYYWLESFVAPFIRPFNRLATKIAARTGMGLDFSPWFAMVAINIIARVLLWIYTLLPAGMR